MTTTRKQYSPKFKARVALESIRGERTLNQLASQFHVHPVQIGHWRKTALEQLADLFVDGRQRKRSDGYVEKDALCEEFGRLKVELDWLKKSWSARLKNGGGWWSRSIRRSVYGASATCWASTGRGCTTSQWANTEPTSWRVGRPRPSDMVRSFRRLWIFGTGFSPDGSVLGEYRFEPSCRRWQMGG